MHVQSCCFADKTNCFLMLSLLSFKFYIQSLVVLKKNTNYEVFYQGIANLFVLISSSAPPAYLDKVLNSDSCDTLTSHRLGNVLLSRSLLKSALFILKTRYRFLGGPRNFMRSTNL